MVRYIAWKKWFVYCQSYIVWKYGVFIVYRKSSRYNKAADKIVGNMFEYIMPTHCGHLVTWEHGNMFDHPAHWLAYSQLVSTRGKLTSYYYQYPYLFVWYLVIQMRINVMMCFNHIVVAFTLLELNLNDMDNKIKLESKMHVYGQQLMTSQCQNSRFSRWSLSK